MASRLLHTSLLALCLSLFIGCGGKEVREEALALRDAPLTAYPTPEFIEVGHPGPYDIILRLTEGALAQMVETSLLGELAQGPVSLGEFSGLTPYFGAEGTRVTILNTCPGCLSISMVLKLNFQVAPDTQPIIADMLKWVATEGETQGRLGLTGRLSLKQDGSGAAISIGDIRLEEAEVLGAVEKGFINPRRTLERYLKSYVGETLETPTVGAALPLPSTLEIGGESLPIAGLGLISLAKGRGHPGELVLGAVTTATAVGDLSPHRLGGGLEAELANGDFGVVLGESLLKVLLEREVARGAAGAPKESHVARLESFSLKEEGISSQIALYHTGRFPWAGTYSATGRAALDGALVIFPHTIVDPSTIKAKGWTRQAKRSPFPGKAAHMPFAILSTLAPYSLSWAEGEGASLRDVTLQEGQLTLLGTLSGTARP